MSNYDFDVKILENEVINFIYNTGITPKKPLTNIAFDGKIHRFAVEGDKSSETAGWYIMHCDGWPKGAVGDWRQNLTANWSFNRERLDEKGREYFTSTKFKEAQSLSEKRRKQVEAEIVAKQLTNADRCRIYWESLPLPEITFPYLKNKDILPLGGIKYCKNKNALAIPLFNSDGVYRSTQWIFEDGTKRFEYETQTKGEFFPLGLNEIKSNYDSAILICEGVATMITIYQITECKFPCIAAMNCGNLEEVASSLKQKYPKSKIIFMADNDRKTEGNPGVTAATAANKAVKGEGIIYPQFKRSEIGSDWNDYARLLGEEEVKDIVQREIRLRLMPPEKRRIYERVDEIDGFTLLHKNFKPMSWAIDGFIASGLTILAGGPKVGKSIFALHIALSICLGGYAFGKVKVKKGSVLYMALEDTKLRVKERIKESNIDFNDEAEEAMKNLTLTTAVPRQHDGGLEYVRDWLDAHEDARLVIIDTLQMFRKQLSGKNSMYSEDYDVVSEIKKLADEYGVAILIIHHLKKAMSEDWLNEVSGSQGIAGAADTILSLKRARTENRGILHRTGRDVEEKDFTMELDGFGWILKGDADEFEAPDWKRNIISYLKEHNSVTPMQLSTALGTPLSTAQNSLVRLVKDGTIKKIGYGTYSLVEYQL